MGKTKELYMELEQIPRAEEELTEMMSEMGKWCNEKHNKGICFLCAKEYKDCNCGTTECCKH